MDRAELADRVLAVVDLVPAGRVVSYGDIGALLGCSPRQVGWVMSHYGHQVPWWRVVSASGDLPMADRARPHWDAERIAVKPTGAGVLIAQYRADLVALSDALPSEPGVGHEHQGQ